MLPLPRLKPRIWPTFNLNNFYGGLNKREAPSVIADNEAQDLLNIDFANGGGFAKRAGTNIVGNDKGNVQVKGLFSAYYGSGAAQLLQADQSASTSGLWYRTTGNWTEVTKDGAATKLADANANMENFYDGSNQVVFISDRTKFQKYKPSDNTLYAATTSPATIGSILRVYKNRLYSVGGANNPERIYFSALGDGDDWGATDYFDVPSQSTNQTGQTGDPIMALANFQNRLIILKSRSIWQYDTHELRLISSDVGCVGNRAFATSNDYLYFADNDGVYRLSGTSIMKVSKKIQSIWDAIPAARVVDVAMIIFKGKLYVATAATGASYNNIILVNYTEFPQDSEGQQAWSYWAGTTANPLAISQFAIYEASTTTLPILCGGHAGVQSATLQLETGSADYDFAGAAQNESIDGYYKTKDFPLSARFKKLFLSLKKRASSYNLNVSAVIDFQTTRHLTYDMYAASGDAITKSSKISYNGKYINYKFATSASSAQPFMVYDGKQELKPLRLK